MMFTSADLTDAELGIICAEYPAVFRDAVLGERVSEELAQIWREEVVGRQTEFALPDGPVSSDAAHLVLAGERLSHLDTYREACRRVISALSA